jgi:large subunit ribosomal protein L29
MGLKATLQELRNLSEPELDEKIVGLKQKLLEYRFQASVGRLEKPSDVKKARRQIARMLTIKKENKQNATKNKTK